MDTIHKTEITLAAASRLSHKELLSFPAATLSALFLSLLSRANLHQQDKRSSFECILAMQQENTETIASAIRFLSTVNVRDIRKVPAVDLSQASLINWLVNSRAAVASALPVSSFNKTERVAPNKARGIIHKSLSPETREQARECLNTLISQNLIPAKVVGLFRNSIKGENLIYTNDALRKDLISYLEKYKTKEADDLISIYKQTASNRTVQERIVLQQLESESESASDSFKNSAVLAIKKMSIAETIAWRKEQLERERKRQENKLSPAEIKELIQSAAQEVEQEQQAEATDIAEKTIEDVSELDMSPENLSWESDVEDEEDEDELPA